MRNKLAMPTPILVKEGKVVICHVTMYRREFDTPELYYEDFTMKSVDILNYLIASVIK